MIMKYAASQNATQPSRNLISSEQASTLVFSEDSEHFSVPEHVIGDLIDGILVLTDQGQIVYANRNGIRVLNQLNQVEENIRQVPQEIWHICQSLIQSKHLFPNQHWLIQSDILIGHSTVLNIRARWLDMEVFDSPCLLLIMEDRQQAIQNIAREEAEQFGLTPREKEVWLLHRNNYTYKQIARALEITPNTVKKHMRSIHVKQKKYLLV